MYQSAIPYSHITRLGMSHSLFACHPPVAHSSLVRSLNHELDAKAKELAVLRAAARAHSDRVDVLEEAHK